MELNRIHNTTANELLTSLAEKAALIIADPPYGIGYRSSWTEKMVGSRDHRKAKKRIPRTHTPAAFDDSTIDPSWLKPAYDCLAETGALYLFTRWDVMGRWKDAIEGAGFKVVQRIVWDKAMWTAGNLSYFGSQTEDILFCVKGKHALQWDQRQGNVWRIGRGRVTGKDGGNRHTTQKPVDLFTKIITLSSNAGDLVIDPFTGSGAACIAAQRLHRRFVGCDINPAFATAAQKWVEKTAPHSLPMF